MGMLNWNSISFPTWSIVPGRKLMFVTFLFYEEWRRPSKGSSLKRSGRRANVKSLFNKNEESDVRLLWRGRLGKYYALPWTKVKNRCF